MTWAQLTAENAFLILSILSGTGAVAVLVRQIIHSKLHNVSDPDPTSHTQLPNEHMSKKERPSLLDRITLLNRNLIQCPSCFTIDHAHTRFCTRCGTSMQSYDEMATNVHDVKMRYLTQDKSAQMFGLSMKINPKTRIGLIIGVQNRESPEQMNEIQY
jgi:hypothetical protein